MANKIETKKNISYSKVIEYIIIGIAILYLIIHLVSPVFNSTYLFWGINITGFLPSWSNLVLITGLISISFLLFRSTKKRSVLLIKKQLQLRYFILGVIALSAIIVFNIDAFVLGDGENILIDIIRSTKNIIVTVRAPLSFNLAKFFYYLSDFINPKTAIDVQSFVSDTITFSMREHSNVEFAFTIQGIILFVLYYLLSIRISRLIFEDRRLRFWSVFFIISSGLIVIFAGYVEFYLLPITLNMAFHYSIIYTIIEKKRFYIPVIVLALCIVAHMGMIIYVPTLLAALWFTYPKQWKKISFAIFCFVFATGTIFFVLGYDPSTIFRAAAVSSSGKSSHIIPFFAITDKSQIYTAFSYFHIIDLMNWFSLVNPFSILMIIIFGGIGIAKRDRMSATKIVLLISAAASIGLIFIFNCDLSMILDWDLFTPYSIPIILTALVFLSESQIKINRTRILHVSTIALAAHSILWLWNLAADSSSLLRIESLMNTKTFSPDGLFFATSHLVRYHGKTGNVDKIIAVRQRLITELLPEDPRGYFSLARHYDRINKEDESMRVLKLAIDKKISDYRIDGLYAEHLYKRDLFRDAIKYFQKYLGSIPEAEMDSVKISAIYTKLGWCYFNVKSFEDFRASLQKSIKFNHSNTEALLLLGRYFVDEKNYKDALPILQSVLTTTKDDKVISSAKELIEICRSK